MARRVAFIRTMSKYRHHSVHTAPSTGSGTGMVWNDRDFCLQRDFSKGSIQMRGRDWRGGRSPFRRECGARPEEWSRRAEPRKAHTNGLLAIFLLGFYTALREPQGPSSSAVHGAIDLQ